MNSPKYIIVVMVMFVPIISSLRPFELESEDIFKETPNVKKIGDKNTQCRWYAESELMRELQELQNSTFLAVIDGIYYYPPLQKRYQKYIEHLNLNTTTYGPKQEFCSLTEPTEPTDEWNANKEYSSICPYRFNELVRTDRYPFKIKVASCNCKHCLGFENCDCVPTTILQLSLKQGECQLNGFYQTLPILEVVPNGCGAVEPGNRSHL